MIIRNLGGHSGCEILLCEDENGKFVRKISSGLDYNDRLAQQCKKQNNYKDDQIIAPKVLASGYNSDELFYFDMEYIQGTTLANYIKTIPLFEIAGLINVLFESIIANVANSKNDSKLFYDKINSLKETTYRLNSDLINYSLERSEKHSWDKIVLSNGHGDLTLENIIIKNNQLYFIDFLDSFYDFWIMDLGTMMQDLLIGWSYRAENIDTNAKIRVKIFRELLVEKLQVYDDTLLLEIYYVLLLKLIRVFPYVEDKRTFKFLEKKSQMLLYIIRKLEGNDHK
ncbi:MAG: phosphotransferase [Streptococcaceae bacterium]|jgi:hypothetical protein|nr:phosphotransferase [Streptococcaceae bacterium]